MNLLTAKELTKHYTDKELFTGADFSIEEKDKVGIVGINGTGNPRSYGFLQEWRSQMREKWCAATRCMCVICHRILNFQRA